VWPSTVHRVLNPASGYAHVSRLSVVYFEHPDYDASLSSFVRPGDERAFEPVVVGEFEYDKRLRIHLIDDAEISKMLHGQFEHREEQHQ
jgi:isopenicillin N synthase-like dioxygenase